MTPQTDAILLNSTRVEWDENRLARRYAFFRRLRGRVRLDLLYYPYWLAELRGRAKWRFFGERPLVLLLAVDARSGRCLRISAPPALREESRVPAGTVKGEGVFPAVLEGAGDSRTVQAHVAGNHIGEECAKRAAETFALSAWGRRCNLPLGPRADIVCTDRQIALLHKPFWIMTPDGDAEQRKEKLFIFDASTGLGGLSEYWNIAEYVMELRGRNAPSA